MEQQGVITPYLGLSSAYVRELASAFETDPNNPALTADLLELIASRNEIAERLRTALIGFEGPVRLRAVLAGDFDESE